MMYKQNLTLKNFRRINEVTSLTSFTLLRQISSDSSCCRLDHMDLKNSSVLGLMAFSSVVPGCNQLNTLVPPSPAVATKKHKEHFPSRPIFPLFGWCIAGYCGKIVVHHGRLKDHLCSLYVCLFQHTVTVTANILLCIVYIGVSVKQYNHQRLPLRDKLSALSSTFSFFKSHPISSKNYLPLCLAKVTSYRCLKLFTNLHNLPSKFSHSFSSSCPVAVSHLSIWLYCPPWLPEVLLCRSISVNLQKTCRNSDKNELRLQAVSVTISSNENKLSLSEPAPSVDIKDNSKEIKTRFFHMIIHL